MTDFIYKPRSGEEVINASPNGTKLFLYSDLVRRGRSPEQLLKILGRNNLILVQDPKRMNSGHWTSLSFVPSQQKAFFFSSYGGKPDEEKVRWISYEALRDSGQLPNIINDLLKYLYLNGWEIHYNDYPYQVEGDRTATCGIWASAFMKSGENPDEFAEDHQDVSYYFRKNF